MFYFGSAKTLLALFPSITPRSTLLDELYLIGVVAETRGVVVMKNYCLGLLCALALCLSGRFCQGDTISVGASVDQGGWDSNFDGNADGFFAANDGFLRVFGDTTYWQRAALEFSISGIQTNSTVNSAILALSDKGTIINGAIIQIHGYQGNGTITSADLFGVSNLLTTYTVNGYQTHYLDVTPYLQTLVNSGASYAGFMVRSAIEGRTVFSGADIASSEYHAAQLRPNLAVDFVKPVPTPSSFAALIGMGVMGLVAAARRRRK